MESIKINLNIQRFANEASAGGVGVSGVTYGVTFAGIDNVYNEIHSYIVDEAETALNNLSAVETAITENWHGVDAERFYENLKTLKDEIIEKLAEYDNSIKEQFNQIIEEWQSFQEQNVKEY